MQESKQLHLFDIKSIMSDVEKVIENGLNKLLVNYIDRHELLEKTHQQLIQLPSIAEELNRRKRNYNVYENEIPDVQVSVKENCRDALYLNEVSIVKSRLDKVEKRLNNIIPILDKFLVKITDLNKGC